MNTKKSKATKPAKSASPTPKKEEQCVCPYCEEDLEVAVNPFCQPCGLILRRCTHCGLALKKGVKICPQCGEPVKAEGYSGAEG